MRELVTLDEAECLRLLETDHAGVGRIAFADGTYPTVLPVNYRMLDGAVVFRTDPGGKLAAAESGMPVAFQTDSIEPAWEGGWSVLVHGELESVHDAADLARLQRLHLRPWVEGPKEHYVRVQPRRVSGRRLQ
jgi:nitroimidazol reductase NimA-like FMN-containing flavoprotein (pyridoxamine 5'-phosphate oxidase superfamily)